MFKIYMTWNTIPLPHRQVSTDFIMMMLMMIMIRRKRSYIGGDDVTTTNGYLCHRATSATEGDDLVIKVADGEAV